MRIATKLRLSVLLVAACFRSSSSIAQTWSAPEFVTSGTEAVALATNGKGTSAVLFWETGPGLMATVGINGNWTAPVLLTTATSVGRVIVAPNGDVLAVWSFETTNSSSPVETQAAFYSGGKWGKTITITGSGSATASSSIGNVAAIGIDAANEATIVWEQLLGSGSCGLEEVTGNSVSGFGTPQQLNSTCLGSVGLAVNSSGEALAVQGGATLEVAPIVGTLRTASGAWGASFDIATPYYGRQRPYVALGDNGTAAVTWRARTFSEYAIYENGVWTAPAHLPSSSAADSTVAVDGSGNAVAAYSGKVSSRVPGGAFQTPIMLGSGFVTCSQAGTFMVSGNSVATRLPGSTTWNQNGPPAGEVAIGPGQALVVVNPVVSVETASVP